MKCEYLFIKGKRKGMVCGQDTKNDITLCCIHKHREVKNKFVYNKIPRGRRLDPYTDFKVVWNKTYSIYLHLITGLILESQNSRDVIGILKGGSICKLDDDDCLSCIEWKLNYSNKFE